MKHNKLFTLCLAIFVSLSVANAAIINGTCGYNLTWSLNTEDSTLVIEGSGNMYNWDDFGSNFAPWYQYQSIVKYVTLPHGLVNIGDCAFYNCGEITSIILPNTVTSIGGRSFSFCWKLKSIQISENLLTIGNHAFWDCANLEVIELPNSLTSIEYGAFMGCSSLINITFGSNLEEIGENIFDDCSNLMAVNVVNDNLFYCSEDGVLYNKAKTTLVICPGGKQGEFNVPGSITDINYNALGSCSKIYSIKVSTDNSQFSSLNGVLYSKDFSKLLFCPRGKEGECVIQEGVVSICDEAFYNCNKIISITLPNTVASIGGKSFSFCWNLKSIQLSENLLSIGNHAFWDCANLEVIKLPNRLTTIESGAFMGCSSLSNITLGSNLSDIGEYAFHSCSNITAIHNYSSVPQIITNDIFNDVDKKTCVLYVPAESIDLYRATDGWKVFNNIQPIEESPEDSCILASGYCGAEGDSTNLSWQLTCDSVLTISGAGAMADFIWDYSSQTYNTPWYNYKDTIKLVVVNEGTTNIGSHAFNNCKNLISATIPESIIKIEHGAFYECGLTTFTIPNSVTSIGDYAFYNCSSLTSVTIPNSVTSIGVDAFYNCSSLTSVTIPNSVTSIGERAFSGCSSLPVIDNVRYAATYLVEVVDNTLSSYNIKEGTKWIGTSAFETCYRLKSIIIPNSVTNIGDRAFYWCDSIANIVVKNGNPIYDSRENCNAIIETATNTIVTGCKNTTIPNSITSIGDYAFWGCDGLTNITIPNSITSIGEYAFFSSGLTRVEIPSSVTNIRRATFHYCSNLTSVTIPNSVTSIGEYAFSECRGLKSVSNYATTPQTINANVFDSVDISTCTLYVPASSVDLYKSADGWKDFTNILPIEETPEEPCIIASGYCGAEGDSTNLTWQLTCDSVLTISGSGEMADLASWSQQKEMIKSIVIADGVTSIGYGAFYQCPNIDKVVLPNGVTRIGDAAFAESGLTSINLPTSIETIGANAFSQCGIESIIIPEKVTRIEDYTFYDCFNLASVTMHEGIQSIGELVFHRCHSLTNITIPSSVTSIAYGTFYYCTNLKAINVDINNKNYCSVDGVLFNSDKTTLIVYPIKKETSKYIIPNSVTEIIYSAFEGCEYLTELTIPNGVTTIKPYTFSSCASLTTIDIPNSITEISERAFFECTSLITISIPASVTNIGVYAFFNCSSLTSITNYAITPQTIDSTAFSNVNHSIPLYVPASSIDLYKSAEAWKEFTNILPLDESPEEPCIIASGFCGAEGDGSNLTWQLTCDSVLTISGEGNMADYTDNTMPWYLYISQINRVILPNNLKNIGNNAFYNCSGLASINIPNSVTSIGTYAFFNCLGLTYITIPNSVISIKEGAFAYCSNLSSITIPNSVKTIGVYVFAYCYNITSIIVEDGNTNYDSRNNCNAIIETSSNKLIFGCKNTIIPNTITSIGYQAFEGCSRLTSIELPFSVAIIENNAFNTCTDLTTVTFPDGLVSIGAGAFYHCNIISITIPSSVTSIGIEAFGECSGTTSMIVANDNPIYDSRNNCNAIIETLSNTLIAGCQSTIIPNSVTSIGNNAFWVCRSLSNITIPNGVTNIGDKAFYGCENLASIEIHKSVKSIGKGAFAYCSKLISITCEANIPPTCGESVFYNVNKNQPLYVPYKSIAAYQTAEGWSEFTNILPIPGTEPCIIASGFCGAEGDGSNLTWQLTCDSVLTISGTGAMADWLNDSDVPWHSSAEIIKEVIIADNLNHIGINAFRNCSHLTSLSGPAIMLSAQAFGNNPVRSVTLTSGELEENHCALLKSWRRTLSHLDLNLAENMSLPDEALNGLYNLQTLALPKDLTSISYMAVAGCVNLQSVSIPISVIEIDQRAFEDCRSLTDLTFAEGSWLTKIGNWAFYNCHNLSELIIPDGVTEIGNAAFYGCAYAQTAHIPASVQSIGDNAFALCTKLSSMQVDAVLPPTVADKTFYEVSTEAPVYVPENSVTNYKSHPVWGKLNIQGKNGSPTDIHNPSADNIETKKLLLNGQILILRGEKIYTITGQEVK